MAPTADKKQVCTELTAALRASPLASAIDPKAFFMQLMTNYAALTHNGVLDLVALYEPLASKYPAAALADLFRDLGEIGERLGFEVRGPDLSRDTDPPEVRQLPAAPPPSPGRPSLNPSQRSGLTVTPRTSLTPSPSGGQPRNSQTPAPHQGRTSLTPQSRSSLTPQPKSLSDTQLTPAQSGLISNLMASLRSTEAGPLLSGPQLNYFLTTHIQEIFDGERFHAQPVFEAVMSVTGVEEEHVYVGFARFRRWLSRSGVTIVEPAWRLDPRAREQLDELANKAQEPTRPAEQAPELPKDPGPAPGESRQQAELRKFGFQSSRAGKAVSVLVALFVLVGGVVVIQSMQPIKALDAAAYGAVFPVREAKIFDGKWLGTLDRDRWLKLTLAQREKALKDLSDVLAKESRLSEARLVGPDGSVIGFELKGKGMTMAKGPMNEGL